jgi:hypothetical protein
MGYTHYWSQPAKLPLKKFRAARIDCANIVKHLSENYEIRVQYDFDDTSGPIFIQDVIQFNGIGEAGHETFGVDRISDHRGDFCKTERKPYDLAVCCCLIVLSHHFNGKFKVSSDGDDNEFNWPLARTICQQVLGYGNLFTLRPRFSKCGASFFGDVRPSYENHCFEYWFESGLKMLKAYNNFWFNETSIDDSCEPRNLFTSSKLSGHRIAVLHMPERCWQVYATASSKKQGQWYAAVAIIEKIAIELGAADFEGFIQAMKANPRDWQIVAKFCDWLGDRDLDDNRIRILLPKSVEGAL